MRVRTTVNLRHQHAVSAWACQCNVPVQDRLDPANGDSNPLRVVKFGTSAYTTLCLWRGGHHREGRGRSTRSLRSFHAMTSRDIIPVISTSVKNSDRANSSISRHAPQASSVPLPASTYISTFTRTSTTVKVGSAPSKRSTRYSQLGNSLLLKYKNDL